MAPSGVPPAYTAAYFRRRRMGYALDQPYDLHSPALKTYRRAARMLGLQPEMRILDAGCGLGAGAWLLAMLGARVTGVDLSEEAIAWATRTYAGAALRKGGSLEFQVADLTRWEPDPDYDAVVVADVLEHFPRPAGVAVLHRLLGALNAQEQPPARDWIDGLFLHLPITANLIDWPLLLKNRLLLPRLRGQVIDHHGDPTHRARYGLRNAPAAIVAAGGRIARLELRVYRPRLRWLEALVPRGEHRLLARVGGAVVTDFDAVILPELIAALRATPSAAEPAGDSPGDDPVFVGGDL